MPKNTMRNKRRKDPFGSDYTTGGDMSVGEKAAKQNRANMKKHSTKGKPSIGAPMSDWTKGIK